MEKLEIEEYERILSETMKILREPRKKKIIEALYPDNAFTLSGLERKTGMLHMSLWHSLKRLKEANLISEIDNGRYKRKYKIAEDKKHFIEADTSEVF